MPNTRCCKIKHGILAMLLLLPWSFSAQTAQVRSIGGSGNDEFRAAVVLSDGYFFIGSTATPDWLNTSKSYLVKLDEALNLVDSKNTIDINNPGTERGVDVLLNAAGEIFVLAQASNGDQGGYDALLAKYTNTEGGGFEQEWFTYIGSEAWDIPQSLFMLDDELYLAGTTYRSGAEIGNRWLCKLDGEGLVQEEWVFPSDEREFLSDAFAYDGQVYMAFERGAGGASDVVLQAFDNNMTFLWEWSELALDEVHFQPKNIDVDEINSVGLVYTRFNDPDFGNETVLLRLETDGLEIGRYQIELSGNQEAACFEWALDVGMHVANTDESFGAGGSGIYIERRINEGSWNNAHVFGGENNEWAYDIIEDSEGRFVICGWTESYGINSKDAYVLRIPDTFVASEYTFETEEFLDNSLLVGLNETQEELLLLHPNPAQDQINISPKLQGEKYWITDLQGRTLKEGVLTGSSIDLEDLPNAVYLLRISSQFNTYQSRIVVQR